MYPVSENAFKNLPTFKGNHSAYWRLLIADYLPSEIQKCLYLDVDMLVLCDIREIFDIPCDSALAAIPDLSKRTGRIIEPKCYKWGGGGGGG
ncbi:MAG: hypothetical protein K2N75_06710, partial [Helicobacter sp.]|uniref:glycosyltransferase n=1 Tax=Helicobacter sp. TaxID=218 RepID=UPI0023D4701A